MKFFTFVLIFSLVLFAFYFAFKFFRFVYVRIKAHLIHRLSREAMSIGASKKRTRATANDKTIAEAKTKII